MKQGNSTYLEPAMQITATAKKMVDLMFVNEEIAWDIPDH